MIFLGFFNAFLKSKRQVEADEARNREEVSYFGVGIPPSDDPGSSEGGLCIIFYDLYILEFVGRTRGCFRGSALIALPDETGPDFVRIGVGVGGFS